MVLLATSLGLFMGFLDLSIVNVAVPDIERSFGAASLPRLSWILSGYSIASAGFMVPFGRLADLVGRKRVYVIALAVFTIASGLCAIAPNAYALIGGRVLQGVAVAALVPSSFALVLAAFPVERRIEAVTLSTAMAALGGGIGPALGGILVHFDDWRLVFLVNLPLGAVAVTAATRALTESRDHTANGRPDVVGGVIFTLAVSAVTLGVVQGQDWGWSSASIIGAFAGGAALTAVFAARNRRHSHPLFDPALIGSRRFTVACLAHGTAMAGFFGYTLANVLFLTSVWHYSLVQVGGALTPGPVVAALVGALSSRVVDRTGFAALLVPGGLIWAAGVAWLALHAGPHPDFLGLWLPAIVVAGIGAGLVVSPGASAAINAAPGDRFAAACGVQQVCRAVAAALGIAVVVAIIDAQRTAGTSAFHSAWTFGAACLVLGGLGSLLFGPRRVEEDR